MKLQTPLLTLATAAMLTLGATALAAPPTTSQTPAAPPTTSQTATDQDPAAQMDKTSTSADTSISMQARFQALDTNGDGYIDRTEAAVNSALLAQFDKLDVNHDGKLSPAEFANAKGLFGK